MVQRVLIFLLVGQPSPVGTLEPLPSRSERTGWQLSEPAFFLVQAKPSATSLEFQQPLRVLPEDFGMPAESPARCQRELVEQYWILPSHNSRPLALSLYTTSRSVVVLVKVALSCAARQRSRKAYSLSATVMMPVNGTASHFSLPPALPRRTLFDALQTSVSDLISRVSLLNH